MNNKEAVRFIAVIDTCNFTKIAINSICQSISNDIKVYTFNSVEELLSSEKNKEINFVFYDALATNDLIVNPTQDIMNLKLNNPQVKVCILSVLHQFMNITNAEHEIDKRVSLDDFEFFSRILFRQPEEKCRRNYSVVSLNRMNLCWQQITLLRAYLLNFDTKSIASILNCNLRKVYSFREGAISKLLEKKEFYKELSLLIDP